MNALLYTPYLIITSQGVYVPGTQTPWGSHGPQSWEDVLKLWSKDFLRLVSDGVGNPPILWFIGHKVLKPLNLLFPAQIKTMEGAKKWLAKQVEQIRASIDKNGDGVDDIFLRARFVVEGSPNIELVITDNSCGENSTHYLTIVCDAHMPLLEERKAFGILGSTEDTQLPLDDTAAAWELNHRIATFINVTGKNAKPYKKYVNPSYIASNTAADLQTLINVKKDVSYSGYTNYVKSENTIEPPLDWVYPDVLEKKMWAKATHLVEFDARSSYLASAGMVKLGIDTAYRMEGNRDIENAINETCRGKTDTLPFGIWEVTLPSQEQYLTQYAPHSLVSTHAHLLPSPVPYMNETESSRQWITTQTLLFLQEFHGITLWDLQPTQAVVWKEQSRKLEAWKNRLKDLLTTDNQALQAYSKELYRSYIGRIESLDHGYSGFRAHHHQPAWAWTIRSDARTRVWRHIKKTIEQYPHRTPLAINTDSVIWALTETEADTINDKSGNLGKFRIKNTIPIPKKIRPKLGATPVKELITILTLEQKQQEKQEQ